MANCHLCRVHLVEGCDFIISKLFHLQKSIFRLIIVINPNNVRPSDFMNSEVQLE